jgi:predicted DsbA family dithiol-disulfide isomerase
VAPRAGLDPRAFKRCLEGRQALERVLADLYDAQGVVDRVPRFVILTGGNAGTVTGPLAAAQFICFVSHTPSPVSSGP